MSDPKLVISQTSWNEMTPELQSRITYESVISLRGELIEVNKKVDILINKPLTPCKALENRVEKLEKFKMIKTVATVLSGFLGGVGGSHLPK